MIFHRHAPQPFLKQVTLYYRKGVREIYVMYGDVDKCRCGQMTAKPLKHGTRTEVIRENE